MTAAAPHQVRSSEEFLHISPVELCTRDFERESRKLISQELHCRTLAEYCRKNQVPRGLRSHLHPTLFKEDQSYCKQYKNILNKCSFDLMVLTIDYLQRSIKKTREKISTIELQLMSCLSEEEWTSLKSKIENVLTEFRKKAELKKKEKFLKDTEDYLLNRVYRWQDPPSGNVSKPSYTRCFSQDKTSSSRSESDSTRSNSCFLRQQETVHQPKSLLTREADVCHHRPLNRHSDSISDLNNLKQISDSCISQSYKKRDECTGRPTELLIESSDKLPMQKAVSSSELGNSSLLVSQLESSVHDKKETLIVTESHIHDSSLTTVPSLLQTGPDERRRQHQSHSNISDEAIKSLEQKDPCCILDDKNVYRQSKKSAQSTDKTKKSIATFPGKRHCTRVSAGDNSDGVNGSSDRSVNQYPDVCPHAEFNKCRKLAKSDATLCRGHPSVDKGPSVLTVGGGQSGTGQHCTSRKKSKMSHGLRSKSTNKCKFRKKESKSEVVFQKTSWKIQECKKCRKKFSIVVIKSRCRRREKAMRWNVRIPGHSITCTDCKKIIHDRRLASGKKTYSCTVCGKRFLHRPLLDLHQKSHIDEKLFVCSLCGKRFVQRMLLLIHEKTHAVNKPYQCMDCGNLFFSKSLFTKHVRTHKERKPCRCSDCGKCFADNSTLIIHQRIHTGEKPFSCKDCGKSFSQHSTLVSHQRIHSGEKPYECHVCGKRFRDRSSAACHQRIHNGEKPFKCQECDKRFTQSCNLRRHERLHVGQKPYICSKCGKAFNEATKLKSHENVHLKNEIGKAQRTK
ncbi:zinc finger protein ZFP2-like isoform X2 [Dendropsophus ebraccatus]|uniref:zinc finger protein ZFP2-like isoform X2 n=1 Tax=Dendropsophus ebraccatus TaxID=150705 RepID=UPI0038311551